MHSSVKLDTPCEFLNITPLNPLISKCQIKVCYVGDEPNRNHSVITKETARQMANSLPGSPIVGFFNENKGDFEEHNRQIEISNGEFRIKETTKPYGFVDLNAKVWFQKFLDDDTTEHEYLMTEGYLWTGQYPEAQRVIDLGNNQSMELDEDYLDATWSKDNNGNPEFFIINEAVISKLCILGEDCEPCFEGSNITKVVQFSFDDGFKEQLFSMMQELKDVLKGGDSQMFTTYAVEIGDSLWSALYRHINTKYPDAKEMWCSTYSIDGIYEENGQKFAILKSRVDAKYYRLNFSITEADGFVPAEDIEEVTLTYVPAAEPQFAAEAVEAYEAEFKAQKKDDEEEKEPAEEDKKDEEDEPADSEEDKSEEEEKDEEEEDKKDKEKAKKKEYILEEIPEYNELMARFSVLESSYNELVAEKESLVNAKAELESQMQPLVEFRKKVEREQKESMIKDTFYMLSDEQKKDVMDNIDTMSLDDIEKELSVVCFRNHISTSAQDDSFEHEEPTTYKLGDELFQEDETIPAWVKAALEVAKTMK